MTDLIRWRTLDQLTIDDEASFRHVALYGDLKAILQRDGYRFRALTGAAAGRWDRALFLNLTFWGADAGGDVLHEERIPADVVAHAAWHHLAARALSTGGAPLSAEALFFGEAIASSFDLYLVGRLLGHAPRSSFLETQVPALGDAAAAAGLDDDAFDQLLQSVAAEPDRAFEDLRQLLFDAAVTLLGTRDVEEAFAAAGAVRRASLRRAPPSLRAFELGALRAGLREHRARSRSGRARVRPRAARGAGRGRSSRSSLGATPRAEIRERTVQRDAVLFSLPGVTGFSSERSATESSKCTLATMRVS